MSAFDILRIAGSALTAQRLRMDVAAGNLANAETTRTAEGGPYVPRSVAFAPVEMGAGAGIEATAIINAGASPRLVYDPAHPDADDDGYVVYPGVDVAAEMTELTVAQKSYQIGITIAEAGKQQARDALELGR
jgi:flagellar basal-body rod protein FlgC